MKGKTSNENEPENKTENGRNKNTCVYQTFQIIFTYHPFKCKT